MKRLFTFVSIFKISELQAEIITIGDEILIEQITNTNSKFIAEELNKIGIYVYQITSIQDDKEHILKAFAEVGKMQISKSLQAVYANKR